MTSEPDHADSELWPESWGDQTVRPRSPAVLTYEARRCHVCGVGNPAFGFSPPITRQEMWACNKHKTEVEQLLRGEGKTQAASRRVALL